MRKSLEVLRALFCMGAAQWEYYLVLGKSLVPRVRRGPTSFAGTITQALVVSYLHIIPQSQPEYCHQSSANHSLFVSGASCDHPLPSVEFTSLALLWGPLHLTWFSSDFSSHPLCQEPVPCPTSVAPQYPWAFQPLCLCSHSSVCWEWPSTCQHQAKLCSLLSLGLFFCHGNRNSTGLFPGLCIITHDCDDSLLILILTR